MWYFCVWYVCTNRIWVQRWWTHQNILALKLLIFFPNLKLFFIVIVVVIICLTHSNRSSFTKNMSRFAPIGTIYRPSDSGSRSTEATDFIQCINGREPKIHELWCLNLDGICREFHPTEHIEDTSGTVREFVTNYLAENGRQIPIIGQLSVNYRVQLLGLSDQAWVSGLPFIANILAHVESTGWECSKNSNQNWRGRFNNTSNITNVAWCACPAYLPRSPVNPHAARRRVRNDFLCQKRQECLLCQSNQHNTLINPQVFWRGQDKDSPIIQWFLFKISVTSVSNCFKIVCKIALCVTRGCCFYSSYLVLLISKFFTVSSSSFDLSIFSLVNIVFSFSLCVFDAWLNVSEVTLLSSAIDYSSMNLRISSQTFVLGNGVFLRSF